MTTTNVVIPPVVSSAPKQHLSYETKLSLNSSTSSIAMSRGTHQSPTFQPSAIPPVKHPEKLKITAKELPTVTKRTGPKGVNPNHHNANVMVKNANENVVHHERIASGNMTSAEKALGFPKNSLASHTEARAVSNTPLKAGDTMTITGQRPPCPSCKGYMNKANAETGAAIRYQWRENGQTQRWIAGGN